MVTREWVPVRKEKFAWLCVYMCSRVIVDETCALVSSARDLNLFHRSVTAYYIYIIKDRSTVSLARCEVLCVFWGVGGNLRAFHADVN